MEEWRDIEGYEGKYQVSNFGRVRTLERYLVRKRIMKPGNVNGYMRINLYDDKGHKQEYVHRLVAKAFIENRENLPYVNHKDEDKANNNVNNLEWCTAQYNTNYGTCIERTKKHTDREKIASKTRKAVCQYTIECKLLNRYESLSECSRITGFDLSQLSKCCLGKIKTVHGYIFKYE